MVTESQLNGSRDHHRATVEIRSETSSSLRAGGRGTSVPTFPRLAISSRTEKHVQQWEGRGDHEKISECRIVDANEST